MKQTILAAFLSILFFACSDNACEETNCNYGTCIEGVCDCEEGFGGDDCTDELTPVRVRIVNVEVLSYPVLNPDGLFWDEFDGSAPDLVYEINQGINSSGVRGIELQDAESLPVAWVDNIFLEPETTYSFKLIDVDELSESEMHSFEFVSFSGTRADNYTYTDPKYDIQLELEYDF